MYKKKRIFTTSLIICILLIEFSTKAYFEQWKNSENQTAYHIALLQIQRGNEKQFTSNEDENTLLTNISKLEKAARIDILNFLELREDKKEGLQNYLSESSTILLDAENFISQIQLENSTLESAMNMCLRDKETADRAYFQSVQEYNTTALEQSLQESLNNGRCASEKRILLNANKVLLQKLIFYHDILQEKKQFLRGQQNQIIENFEIFKENTIKELEQINILLQKYRF